MKWRVVPIERRNIIPPFDDDFLDRLMADETIEIEKGEVFARNKYTQLLADREYKLRTRTDKETNTKVVWADRLAQTEK